MFYKFILSPFIENAIRFLKNNSFYINEQYYTYENFIQRISSIIINIRDLPDDNIAIIAHEDIDSYAAIFAIWFTGKAYIPLNPDTPNERNQNIIDQVSIATVLDSNSEITSFYNAHTLCTRSFVSAEYSSSFGLLKKIVADINKNENFDLQLAYVLFTSGSTGIPKGVPITKANVASFTEAFWAMGYKISETDRCLQMFELTFDLSVMSYLIPLLKGACVYTIPKNKIKYSYIFELMDEHALTVSLMVPSILNYLRKYFEEIDCPQMRYSLFCGEALNENICEEWSKCIPNARIDNVYGPTEDTIFCTYYTFRRDMENDSHNGVLSIGKSMLNNIAVVFDENNKVSDINQCGELCLAGAQLTPGYINNAQLNRERFFTSIYNGVEIKFYKTGDLCVLRENGHIDYIGRKDFQAKIQGYRVELSEVEYHVKEATNHIINLIALATENKTGNNEIALIFESDPFDTTFILEYMKAKVPAYMVPTKYFFAKPFPLNTNEKTDRRKLETMFNLR